MKVEGKKYRSIWVHPENRQVIQIIDQRFLPHEFVIEDVTNTGEMVTAIREMHVRGAGLIGAAAGFGMYLGTVEALRSSADHKYLENVAHRLIKTRPTAVNLTWAIDRQLSAIAKGETMEEKVALAYTTAVEIANEDAEHCMKIGIHGFDLFKQIQKKKKGGRINVLTHCNAGWLAFVDYGSATSPIYTAYDRGIDLHVWVDETRPRNQGARLTAWELLQHGVPHTVIADNVGGHLMQHGLVDLVITGADRVTKKGDVANKIGTYLKALASYDNQIPFYVALPSSSIDWKLSDGIKEIPIEQRTGDEVRYINGLCNGEIKSVLLTPALTDAANYAFDVTPSRLVTGLITERGICTADEKGIFGLFPEFEDGIVI